MIKYLVGKACMEEEWWVRKELLGACQGFRAVRGLRAFRDVRSFRGLPEVQGDREDSILRIGG